MYSFHSAARLALPGLPCPQPLPIPTTCRAVAPSHPSPHSLHSPSVSRSSCKAFRPLSHSPTPPLQPHSPAARLHPHSPTRPPTAQLPNPPSYSPTPLLPFLQPPSPIPPPTAPPPYSPSTAQAPASSVTQATDLPGCHMDKRPGERNTSRPLRKASPLFPSRPAALHCRIRKRRSSSCRRSCTPRRSRSWITRRSWTV